LDSFAFIRVLKWYCSARYQEPLHSKRNDAKGNLFLQDEETGRWQFGKLLMVVFMISIADLVFALDSTASKTGEVKNRYINLSSSLMAMFTLRALFFVVRNMAECFDTVKCGICTILVFIGVEMMVSEWVNVPSDIFCCIITVLFFASLGASWINVRNDRSKGANQGNDIMCSNASSEDVTSPPSETASSSSSGSLVTTMAAQALLGERGDAAAGSPEQGRGVSSSVKAKTKSRMVSYYGKDKEDIWSVLDTPPHSPVAGPRKDKNDTWSVLETTDSRCIQEAAVTPVTFGVQCDDLDVSFSGENRSPRGPFSFQSEDLDVTFGRAPVR